ncbi:ATP-binding cassette domain-containing protein [Kurthia populi]|uniref:ATP-binding cassette domain-containing protein n=1 Tax=Kurthia populi TaxID=1562132 RepID=A0ABW5Y4G9_9BACL
MNAIEVTNLVKTYNDKVAVNDISFTVEEGAFFAFLGANGAGKSMTIEILCTLRQATTGEVTVAGHSLGTLKGNEHIRRSIGIVFQQNLLDDYLTVYENIRHRGRFYQQSKKEFEENYAFVNHYLKLDDIAHKRYEKLSGGQRRRADIARALIHRPHILFLDEPTTGLDPQTRRFVWNAVRTLCQETNMTIFLTTHYMEEAAVADKIIIMKEGTIVAEGSPESLKAAYAADKLIIVLKEDAELPAELHATKIGERYYFQLEDTRDALPLLLKLRPYIASFEVIKGSLDDVFIRLNEERRV